MQERVARHVLDMVPDGLSPSCILDAGCGPGRLLAMALQRWPDAQGIGVDIAPGMIQHAATRVTGRHPIDWVVADAAIYQPTRRIDLVVSSSALHWLQPFESGIAHVVALARPGGLAALAIMLDGTMRELRAAREAVAPHKPPAGRLPTMHRFEEAIRNLPGARIRRLEQVTSEYDMPSAADVLSGVHAMGVTGGDVSRSHAPLTRRELQQLTQWYDRHAASPNGVRVTFVVGYALVEWPRELDA